MLFESEPFYQILRMLVIIISALGMQASITVWRPALKQNLLLLCGYIGYCFLLCAVCIPAFGLLQFIRIALLAITVPGIYIMYLIGDVPLSQHIFTTSTQLIIAAYVTGSVTLLGNRLNSSLPVHILSLALAYLAVTLLEAFFLRRIYLRIAAVIQQGWGSLSVISFALLVLTLIFAHFPAHYTASISGSILLYALGAAIVVIYCAIFYFLKVRDDLSMQERNREILNLQLQNIKKNTADAKRKAGIAKKERQDAFALLSDIAGLAKERDWDAILEAIDKEAALNGSPASTVYCSDPILNATLDSYLRRAKNSGISVETHLNLGEALPNCCTEFSICLANALENAIKACEKLPKNRRQIVVKCTGEPNLMFKIENTYSGEIAFTKEGVPMSPSNGHGIGIRSIIAFCEKHDALYSFHAKNGWFEVTVAL